MNEVEPFLTWWVDPQGAVETLASPGLLHGTLLEWPTGWPTCYFQSIHRRISLPQSGFCMRSAKNPLPLFLAAPACRGGLVELEAGLTFPDSLDQDLSRCSLSRSSPLRLVPMLSIRNGTQILVFSATC
jgi:hypothetical protein